MRFFTGDFKYLQLGVFVIIGVRANLVVSGILVVKNIVEKTLLVGQKVHTKLARQDFLPLKFNSHINLHEIKVASTSRSSAII